MKKSLAASVCVLHNLMFWLGGEGGSGAGPGPRHKVATRILLVLLGRRMLSIKSR